MGLTKRFKAGDVLFERGQEPGAMYVLLEGRLGVWAGDERLATVSEPGSFVGELSFLTGLPRTADVRAETDGRALVVHDVESFFKDDTRHALAVAKDLARRFDALNRKFLALKRIASEPAPTPETIDAVVRVLNDDQDSGATFIA